MENRKTTEAEFERAVALLRQRLPGLRAVYLFGSVATGEERPESDVDLAVLPAAPLTSIDRFELASELAEVLGRQVDLVDLGHADTVLLVQVIGNGRRLFASGGAALEEFESRALSDYARLNEERAGILEDIRARGRIHG